MEDDEDEEEDPEESATASVFMELELQQWNSAARRINHSQEDTIASGGSGDDVPRSDTVAAADFLRAFLRRFRIVVLLSPSLIDNARPRPPVRAWETKADDLPELEAAEVSQ